MAYNSNYGFKYPAGEDFYNVKDFNDNFNKAADELDEIKKSVAGKADNKHTHNATIIAANTDLNNISDEGYYYCNSGNSASVTNKPDNVTFFGLRITKISGGVFSQELITSGNRKFIRIYWSGGWTEWTKFAVASEIPSVPDSLPNPNALTVKVGNTTTTYDGSDAKSVNINASSVGAAASSHTHKAEDITSGVLSVERGGTGAATASGARTALGLGTAATKAYTTAVSSGSDSLVTSGAVYTAINNLNINNRTHIVIASYDTKNPFKANADYTCTSSNASSVLKTAIAEIAVDGKIELLDGTYNLQYFDDSGITLEPLELPKAMTLEGCGSSTVIKQPTYEGEALNVFNITGNDVKIKKMMICDGDISSPVSMISQQSEGAVYEDVFFVFNGKAAETHNACITGKGSCKYTRIQNCRVYKNFNNSNKVMFDFSSCTSFEGVIGGNISSGYNNISVKFANESHKNNTAIYGHTNIDITTES